jgi:hypothetical protein
MCYHLGMITQGTILMCSLREEAREKKRGGQKVA